MRNLLFLRILLWLLMRLVGVWKMMICLLKKLVWIFVLSLLSILKSLDDDKIFNDEHKIIFYCSVLKLFQKNDVSVMKRIAKLLFNINDLKNLNVGKLSDKKINLLAKSFQKILHNKIDSLNKSRMCFIILDNIAYNNEKLMETILDPNSYNFFYYCYKNSINTNNEWNKEIIDCIQSFIRNNSKSLEKIIFNFENKMKNNKNFNNVDFLNFILKYLIDSNISLSVQLKLVHSLIEISLNLIQSLFSKDIKMQKNSENELLIGNNFDKILSFILICINQIENMFSTKSARPKNEVIDLFKDLENRFCDFPKIFMEDKNLLIFFLGYFEKYFKMMIMLNNITNINNTNDKELVSDEDLPNWYFILFKFLAISNDRVTYHVLKFIYDLFEIEKDYRMIKKYQIYLYHKKKHFEENQLCFLIFQKIIDIIEISDFKELCLHYYLKFVRINFKFVSKRILQILEKKNSQNFVKIALLWNYTSHYTNSDCMLVLQDSVFLMLDHAKSFNPILLNHFKNWLINSYSSFRIILDSIIKRILKFTNWVKKEKKVYYNYPFDCDRFLESLEYIEILIKNCRQIFIQFLPNKEVSSEFDFFNKEINLVLGNMFVLKKKNKYAYLIFIIKILLRYFIGELNPEVIDEKSGDHLDQIFLVKEKIAKIFEILISNLKMKNDNLILKIGLKILPFILINLEKSLIEKQITSELVYLNSVKFLVFETNISLNEYTKKDFNSLILNDKTIDIFLLGLKSRHSFIVKEFITFFNKFNIILNNNLDSKYLTKLSERILFSYLDSLTAKCAKILSLKEEEITRVLMKILLEGLKQYIEFYFKEINEKTIKKNTAMKVFTFGLGGKDEISINFKKDQKTCEKLLYHFETIFQRLLVCWKDIEIVKDFKIFYKFEKNQIYSKNPENLEIFGISKSIIEIVEPLCYNFKDKIIDVLLIIWIKNNNILLPTNIYFSDINIENIKVIEMILQLNISPLDFLAELKNSKPFKNLIKLERYKKTSYRKVYYLIRQDAVYEINLLSFLYCYLKYSHFKDGEFLKIYVNVFTILNFFEASYTPSTLLIMLDIFILLIDKFEIRNTEFNKFISYNVYFVTEVINKLIRILIGEYTIIFSEKKKTYDVILPLNPSIWNLAEEKIKRLERKQIVNSESKLKS